MTINVFLNEQCKDALNLTDCPKYKGYIGRFGIYKRQWIC